MKNKVRRFLVSVPAVLGVAAMNAYAAVPADVTTAIDSAKTDALSVGTIMLGVVAALLGIAYIRRQMH